MNTSNRNDRNDKNDRPINREVIDYLNSLKSNVKEINLSKYNLTELPDLSKFKEVKHLFCSYNQLTSLPPLNDNLLYLYCQNNQLTSLPPLNNKLIYLNCSNNKLTSLPPLNNVI